jgi:hypothetical protein
MAVPKGMFSVITVGKSLVSHVAGSLLVATAVSGGCRGAVGGCRAGSDRGAGRGRSTIRERCLLSRGRRLGGDCAADIAVLRTQVGVFSGWPRIRRCRLWSPRWQGMSMRCWTRSGRPVPRHGSGCEAKRAGLEGVCKFVAWLQLPRLCGTSG